MFCLPDMAASIHRFDSCYHSSSDHTDMTARSLRLEGKLTERQNGELIQCKNPTENVKEMQCHTSVVFISLLSTANEMN